jgi:signal transduction histidine kinase
MNQNGHRLTPSHIHVQTLPDNFSEPPILSMHTDASNVACFLQDRRKPILDEWMRRRVLNANRRKIFLRSRKAWMDHVPKIFDRLLVSIAHGGEAVGEVGEAHGDHRLHQGFDLAESVLDINVLADIIYEQAATLIESEEADFTPDSIHEIHATIGTFFNACIVETAITHIRSEDAKYQRRVSQLSRRMNSLDLKLREHLKIVEGSTHDLKGSTEILVGLAQNVQKKSSEGPQAADLIGALLKGLVYNQRIIEDLSLLSHGTQAGPREVVDASEFVKEITERTALGFGENSSRIEWEHMEAIQLRTHRLGFERIVANLIENALSHGDGGNISVKCASLGNEGDPWCLEIENGLREKLPNQERFDSWGSEIPFVESGLGLTVVTTMVESMGGKLCFRIFSNDRFRVRVVLENPIGKFSKASK